MLSGEEIKSTYFRYGDSLIYNLNDRTIKELWYGGPNKEPINSRKIRIRTTVASGKNQIYKTGKIYNSKINAFQQYKGVYFMPFFEKDINHLNKKIHNKGIMKQLQNDINLIYSLEEQNPSQQNGKKGKKVPLLPNNLNVNYPSIINNSNSSKERINTLRTRAKIIRDVADKLWKDRLLNTNINFINRIGMLHFGFMNGFHLIKKLNDTNLKHMDKNTYYKYDTYLSILSNITRFKSTRNL